jgi:hypothetical protein
MTMKKLLIASMLTLAASQCFALPATEDQPYPVVCKAGEKPHRTVFSFASRSIFDENTANSVLRLSRGSDGPGIGETIHCVKGEVETAKDWANLRQQVASENTVVKYITVISTFELKP